MSSLPSASRLHVGSILAAAAALAAALATPALGPRSPYLVGGLIVGSAYLAYRAHRLALAHANEQHRHLGEMSDLQLTTIEALALAIAAQQEAGDGRLRRVRVYATGLARALGMSETEVPGVNAAALLHDIGKLAVPEYLLWKAGPLAPEELQKIRRHPQAGAAIVGGVPFPYPVASIILSHHERWDGAGYPVGLVGEDIPLGARILATTDYFDALMSEPAMTPDAALEQLQHERGHALDPRVVDAFVRAYPELAAEAEAAGRPSAHADRDPPSIDAAGGSTGLESPPYAKALHEISLAHREIHALYDIAQAMSRSLGVHATMTRLSDTLSALVPLSSCALFVPGEDAGTIGCRFAGGVDADRIERLTMRDGQWSTEWIDWRRAPLSQTHSRPDPTVADGTGERTVLASALLYPLIFNERFVGMLAVYHTDPAVYTDDHARLLGRICEQAAAAIHHALVYEQTQEDSFRDALTGLPNARYLFIHLSRELARAERLQSKVSLLLMDLDGFKDINDSCGHNVGDKALQTVAGALQAVIRRYDVCVRYAGDEFVVVLAGCGKDEAEQKRLELQKAIDDLAFDISPGRRLSLAISAGLAVFPHDGTSRDELLATADQRMYGDKTRRKRHGVVPL